MQYSATVEKEQDLSQDEEDLALAEQNESPTEEAQIQYSPQHQYTEHYTNKRSFAPKEPTPPSTIIHEVVKTICSV